MKKYTLMSFIVDSQIRLSTIEKRFNFKLKFEVMKIPKLFYLLFLCSLVLHQNCQNSPQSVSANTPVTMAENFAPPPSLVSMGSDSFKMRGLSFVAPPKPFSKTPMMDVKAVAADWIAVIPYGFTRPGEATVHYGTAGWKWWGEGMVGVKTTIDSAHRAGIHVMLKPQVYVPGGWTGALDYATDEEWIKWEKAYEDYLMPFVDIAESMKVGMVCIGTEFKMGVVKRETFWRNLIKKIRLKYHGKLVYAANWDEYPIVPFWDALDYIGVNAYFPLVQKETPSVSDLQTAWKPYFDTLKSFQKKCNKPMLFTEFGYLSVDGCAFNSWEIEKRIHSVKINEEAQANALDGLFSTFWKEPWWAGGFLWKWFPEGQGHEGYIDKDYTPQGKKAEIVLKKWYGK